jgi:DNA-binding NtrC family response regulator
MNILIVEDNKYQLDNLKKMVIEGLGDERGNIYCASDIATAKQIYADDDIHFFMLDISLGYESGLELADEIRRTAKYSDAFIAIISAHKKFEDKAFTHSKCHVFVEKPYKKEAILELVNHALVNYLEKV